MSHAAAGVYAYHLRADKTEDFITLRVRSYYFKVKDMDAEVRFWRTLLEVEPVKSGPRWSEFLIAGQRIGFLLNDFGEELAGCSSVPVLELDEGAMASTVDRARRARSWSWTA
ncbi:MAG: hypothetical protein ACK540_11250 [Betaproteobacteria bacterium]